MNIERYWPDVVFLSYDEPNAEENFRQLRSLAPAAKRVHDVKGIFEAYRTAAELSASDHFFVVEADNWVLDDFSFALRKGRELAADLYIWQSRNAVNGLNWYFGSLKLIARKAIMSLSETNQSVDIFVAIPGKMVNVAVVVSETRFNSSAFSAWRAGFRECAKLAGGAIKSTSVARLLETWQSVGADRPFGGWCIAGARMGAAFGSNLKSADSLLQINDYGWLREQFEKIERAGLTENGGPVTLR